MKTVAMGEWGAKKAAIMLDNKCKVPFSLTEVPIGLKATDRSMQELSLAGRISIPEVYFRRTWAIGRCNYRYAPVFIW